jgi:hypothetical protein
MDTSGALRMYLSTTYVAGGPIQALQVTFALNGTAAAPVVLLLLCVVCVLSSALCRPGQRWQQQQRLH